MSTDTTADILAKLDGRHTITVAAGITCAFLSDERNLREYLVAGELVSALRDAGHIVHYLLFDDSLDPLTFRQLRVAVNKDPDLIEKYQHYCGKPIAHIPDPSGTRSSWAANFEDLSQSRLAQLGCHPSLVSTAKLYEKGMYLPYIRFTLQQEKELREYLDKTFVGYQPERLFWPICESCGYIDETSYGVSGEEVEVVCTRCGHANVTTVSKVRGKLNWKLDCAARWAMFDVAVEPFNKAYMEPQAGSFAVAQGICRTFFKGPIVEPVLIGMVEMDKTLGGKLVESLPPQVLKSLMVERHRADLTITEERVVLEASRVEVLPNMTFLDVVKQLVPAWLLNPTSLRREDRDLMSFGLTFAQNFLNSPLQARLPNRSHFDGELPSVLFNLKGLIGNAALLRSTVDTYDQFVHPMKILINTLGADKKKVQARLRIVTGQEEGTTTIRLLYSLPIDYLRMLEAMIGLYLEATSTSAQAVTEEQPRSKARVAALEAPFMVRKSS